MILGVISDIHQNSDSDRDVLKQVLSNIQKNSAVGLLMAGDVGDYHNDRVKAFNTIIDSFPDKNRKNLALLLGNHDVRICVQGDGSLDPDLIKLYHSYLDRCNLSYDNGTMCVDVCIEGYHFLCLNTDVGLKDQMQLNSKSISWLKDTLSSKAEEKKPIFIITHQAFNSSHWRAGLFGGFGPQDKELKEIFLKYPQIVMLNGHIHNGFGVIECIQRPFGTLVEIPSLTRGENGITKKGCGYLLRVSDDKLVFEAWDFYENKHLLEHDITLLIPTLSVLKNTLPTSTKNSEKLINEANALMRKEYINDRPSGDGTYLPPKHYGISKIYDKNTWDRINTLRNKISAFDDDYFSLEFKNGGSITEDMIP